jgi:hypothetical protein
MNLILLFEKIFIRVIAQVFVFIGLIIKLIFFVSRQLENLDLFVGTLEAFDL